VPAAIPIPSIRYAMKRGVNDCARPARRKPTAAASAPVIIIKRASTQSSSHPTGNTNPPHAKAATLGSSETLVRLHPKPFKSAGMNTGVAS